MKKFVTTNMFNCHNTIAYWGLLDFLCSLTSFWGAPSAKMKGVKHKFQEKCFMKQNLAQNIVGRKKNSHFVPDAERKNIYEIDPGPV